MAVNETRYYGASGLYHGHLEVVMGTRLELLLAGIEQPQADLIWKRITGEALRLDRMLSRFHPTSQLSALNRITPNTPTPVGDELWQILLDCRRYHILTQGYFDISLTDYTQVVLTEATRTLHFATSGIRLDLGGYAKGYALNRIQCILHEAGVEQALVNFGNSSVLAIGNHPYGSYWPVGIANPFRPDSPLGEARLTNNALSISGNLPNRPQHILHPQSGHYITGHKLTSVISPDAAEAEALSTALMACPSEEVSLIVNRFPQATYQIYEND